VRAKPNRTSGLFHKPRLHICASGGLYLTIASSIMQKLALITNVNVRTCTTLGIASKKLTCSARKDAEFAGILDISANR
jgi:hypothetical protein